VSDALKRCGICALAISEHEHRTCDSDGFSKSEQRNADLLARVKELSDEIDDESERGALALCDLDMATKRLCGADLVIDELKSTLHQRDTALNAARVALESCHLSAPVHKWLFDQTKIRHALSQIKDVKP